MAAKKISELPAAAAVTGTDLIPIVQGGATVKALAAGLPVSTAAQAALDVVESGRGARTWITATAYPQFTILTDGTATYRVLVTGYTSGASITVDVTAGKLELIPGVAVPAITSGGSFGAAATIALSTQEKWLYGTLSANHTLTVTNIVAGARARLLLKQDAVTARTFAVNDGTTTTPVPVPATLGATFEVALSSPDGVDLYVEVVGVPGATGTVGQTGPAGPTGAAGPTGPATALTLPTAGEETINSILPSSVATMTSGFLRLSYFTALTSETITKVLLTAAGTAAGATPTLVRAGVWSVDASDNLVTMLASTPNDTTLLGAANAETLKTFSASFNKVAGTRYAVGLLVVTAAAAPTVPASLFTLGLLSGTTNARRRKAAAISALSDLPATATVTSANNATADPYFLLVP